MSIPFSFGIITAGDESARIGKTIESIERENIQEYEIIIVGGVPIAGKNVRHIPFDEASRVAQWITGKKNIITAAAKFENIVYMHDYFTLDPGWYQGFLQFGDDWRVCMNKIVTPHGLRHIDWVLCPTAARVTDSYSALLPYDVTDLSYYQYISGAYWVAKKSLMQEFPLDERRHWGSAEDLEWSKRVNLKYEFSMNPHSQVRMLKDKHPTFGLAHENKIAELRARPCRQRFVWQDLDLP